MAGAGFKLWMDGRKDAVRAQSGQSVLASLIAEGNDWIPVGCRSGGCGVCRIHVLEGDYRALPMNRSRVSEADEGQRIGLACRIIPLGDLRFAAKPLEN